MCNCIEIYDVQLKEQGYNTEIVKPLMFDASEPVAVIATRRLVDRITYGPVTMFASYCPFCGVKYPEATPAGAAEGEPVQ